MRAGVSIYYRKAGLQAFCAGILQNVYGQIFHPIHHPKINKKGLKPLDILGAFSTPA